MKCGAPPRNRGSAPGLQGRPRSRGDDDMAKTIAIGAAALLALSAAATAQISGDVVKIGVLTDQSGNFSSLSGTGSVLAAEMAVADYGGMVAGKPIQVINADHQNKTDVGLQIARRWFDVDGVDAIVDVPISPPARRCSATRPKSSRPAAARCSAR